MLHHHSRTNRSRGQVLVEFTMVIPLLLLMLFGIVDVGRVLWANDVAANAAREGARFASVGGDSPLTNEVTKDDIKAHTLRYLIAAGTGVVIEVCYSSVQYSNEKVGCSGDNDEKGVTNTRGALVTVSVTTTVPILTGSLLGMGDFKVSSASTVLVNN
jgi:Flp pilus assembly protein TadG